jgi:acyl carrier protein
MNVIEHIKEMISACTSEEAKAWANRWFIRSRQIAATGVVQQIIAITGGELDQLTDETRLIEDLALNELRRVQLVVGVEQHFNVKIGDRDAEGIQTIGQLVECVYSKSQNIQPIELTKGK